MSDEHEVIDLYAVLDSRLADGGTIDTRIRLHLDVVANHNLPGLQNLAPAAFGQAGKAKAVRANHYAILQKHTIADPAGFSNHGVGVGEKIVSDLGVPINRHEAVKDCISSDFDILVDKTVRADVRPACNSGRRRDDGRRMDTRFIARRLMKHVDCPGKIQLRVGGAKKGYGRECSIALDGQLFCHQCRRGCGSSDRVAIALVRDEGELTRLGILNPGHIGDFDFSISLEHTAETLGNFFKFHP